MFNKYYLRMAFFIFLGLSFTFLIIMIRRQVEGVPHSLLAGLNIVALMLGIGMAYRVELYRKYWTAYDLVRKLGEEKAAIRAEREQMDEKIKTIRNSFKDRVADMTRGEQENRYAELAGLNKDEAEKSQSLKSQLELIENHQGQCRAIMEQDYERGKSQRDSQ